MDFKATFCLHIGDKHRNFHVKNVALRFIHPLVICRQNKNIYSWARTIQRKKLTRLFSNASIPHIKPFEGEVMNLWSH